MEWGGASVIGEPFCHGTAEAALQRALRYLIVNGRIANKDGRLTIVG